MNRQLVLVSVAVVAAIGILTAIALANRQAPQQTPSAPAPSRSPASGSISAVASPGQSAGASAMASAAPLPSPEAGNPLQPLALDLTWIYRASGGGSADTEFPYVISVVGREPIDGQQAWLLEFWVGTTAPSRMVVIDRGGEVWAVAVEAVVDGTSQRTVLRSPQLLQPRPASRIWTADFSDAPDPWRFTSHWSQKPNGTLEILGAARPAWLLEGDLTQGDMTSREVDSLVEGIGLTSISVFFDGGNSRYDLVDFGRDTAPGEGRYRGASGDTELQLEIRIDGGIITIGNATPSPVRDMSRNGDRITFTFDRDGTSMRFDGRLRPAGLIGTATDPAGREVVVEFVRVLPPR
jgi:hypothetical protein